MAMENPNLKWMKHVKAVDKHLHKNEKWFQRPEKKMTDFQSEFDKWDKEFIKAIKQIEDYME